MREEFERDRTKERLNRPKHGVAFDEASTVFEDPSAITIADDPRSKDEDRATLRERRQYEESR
jgi:uncharacterized protein